MAPQKRARYHEDDAVIAVESASSSLRPDAVRSLFKPAPLIGEEHC